MTLLERTANRLRELRAKRPLVHNITNYVVMNSTANSLLALGASPVMAHAEEEVEEMAAIAGAVVLNIGTLSELWVRAMFKAAKAARARNIPVILDPVGSGATRLRTETAKRLLRGGHLTVVRGNASEILSLGTGSGTRGVDAAHSVEQARETAVRLALQYKITCAVTGPEDFVTDGQRSARIRNGHPSMARVTGTGCAATAIIGSFCAVEPDSFAGAVEGLVVFGIAGELAAQGEPGPGTYQVKLLDALADVTPQDICARGRIMETGEPQ